MACYPDALSIVVCNICAAVKLTAFVYLFCAFEGMEICLYLIICRPISPSPRTPGQTNASVRVIVRITVN